MVSLSIMIISAELGIRNSTIKNSCSSLIRSIKKTNIKTCYFSKLIARDTNWYKSCSGYVLGDLVAAEFLAGTTGIGFVENVAKKYFQYEVIWITIFIMGMLGLLFDITLRKIIDKTIPWSGKG